MATVDSVIPIARTQAADATVGRDRATALRIAGAVAAAVAFQALILSHAYGSGYLAGLIPWDDCQTLVRGWVNLGRLERGGSLLGGLANLRMMIVHSPISDLQTALGLVGARGQAWGPYVLNGAAILPALYAVLVRAARPGPALAAALALLMLFQPLTVSAATFLKADWKGGLLMAAAIFALNQAAARGDRRPRAFGSALIGVAIAGKLTAFYAPVLGAAAILAFELVAWFAESRPCRIAPRAVLAGFAERLAAERPELARCLLLALGPFAVFFTVAVLGERHLIGYILYALGDTWRDGLDPARRLVFYSPFARDGGAWGALAWTAPLAMGAAFAVAVRRRDPLILASQAVTLGLAALFLIPLVLAGTSNLEFGAAFLGVILGGTLSALTATARAFPRSGAAAALALGLVGAAVTPLDPPLYGSAALRPTQAEIRRLNAVYAAIADEIVARGPGEVRLFYEHALAPFPNLTLLLRERTGRMINVDRLDTEPAPADIAGVRFLLTLAPAGSAGVHGLDPRFEASRRPAAVDRQAASLPDFRPVRTVAVPGGEVRLYQRRPGA